MKKFYSYDYNGKYIGEVEAELCQVTELKKLSDPSIESIYIIPAYSTEIEPYFNPSVEEAFFVDGAWVVKETPIFLAETPAEHVYSYKELRAMNYPNALDYLDGIVKGDTAQVQKYIDDCMAVKLKYPKV